MKIERKAVTVLAIMNGVAAPFFMDEGGLGVTAIMALWVLVIWWPFGKTP